MQLLDCVYHFNSSVPDAYSVYVPLATASLGQLLGEYHFDLQAKLTLLIDYLKGLSYLNDELQIMHRDINPNNLAITCFQSPRGIILDLDAATTAEWSMDHMKGTVPYLAPEIVDLKNPQLGKEQKPYEKSVDIWALGLSAFEMYSGRRFQWAHFLPQGDAKSNVFTPEAYAAFHQKLVRYQETVQVTEEKSVLGLIRQMIDRHTTERISASEGLAIALALKTNDDEKGTIFRKTPPKRRLGA